MSDPHADATADPAVHEHAAVDPAATDPSVPDHGTGEHGHGEALGPIDWVAWGVGVVGVLIGLGTAFAFAIATNRLG